MVGSREAAVRNPRNPGNEAVFPYPDELVRLHGRLFRKIPQVGRCAMGWGSHPGDIVADGMGGFGRRWN